MAASANDLLKKLARRWVGQIGAGGVADSVVTTVPLSSTTNLPEDTAIVAVIDRVDSAGTATPTKEESVIGVVSGNNLTDCIRGVEGTAQAHSAGVVVEILVTAKGWNDLIDALLVEHGQDGKHTTISQVTTKKTIQTINTATDAATVTFDLALGNIQQVTLGGNRTLALSNVSVGQCFVVKLIQDATGSRTVTWFSTIKWDENTAPTLTTTANKWDVFGFICRSSGNYDGFIIGQGMG